MLCGCLDPNLLPPLLTTSFCRHSNTDTTVTFITVFQHAAALAGVQAGCALAQSRWAPPAPGLLCAQRLQEWCSQASHGLSEGWDGQLRGQGKVMSMFSPIFPAPSLSLLAICDFTESLSDS